MSRKFQVTGPHNQRMATLNQRVSNKQLFQIYSSKLQDPLKQLIDRYKKQSRSLQQYNQSSLGQKIQPFDKLLEYNGRLAPALISLEKQNNILRGEISVLSHQLRKSLDACQSLIQQNQQQKNIIMNKNQDIRKIIETIAVNETEMKGELQHKNYLLQQENSILIKHLEEIKIEKFTWTETYNNLQEEMDKIRHKFLATENHLEETLMREKELSKRLFVVDQELNGSLNENTELKRVLENEKMQSNRLKNELQLAKVEQKASIKDKFEAEITNIIQQYQLLKSERFTIIKTSEKYKLQCEELENQVLGLERQLHKAISNLELTNSLLNEQKTKNANLQSANGKLEGRVNELKGNNESMRYEIERGQNIAMEKERMYQKEAEGLRFEMEERNREVERKLKDIRQGAEMEMTRKQRELEEMKRNNEHLKGIVERRN